ncbi:MAG: FUSC family protein [Micrococcales bacterium]|nr:FUSC family protein [Micrococcales bacterium]MBT5398529.1 FUSC family protein [Micrococcales bacterium]MBT5431887.1 FUSC family protein [Micrococcales bacterium]MBT5847961.1 FUSC family protein [Micrococcales bacterium]MBT7926343.1 FUSC family protein [Micrococcales bacterium]
MNRFVIRFSVSRVRDSLWTISQIVLAAMTAYSIAHFGLGHAVPLLAVTVAISSLGFSRDTKPKQVLSTAIAMFSGVVLSETLLQVFGKGVIQLGFAILLALLLARLFTSNPAFTITVAIQAVLVQLLQTPVTGIYSRAIDGLIGGLVALIFVSLLPRNPIRLARQDSKALFAVFRATLSSVAAVLRAPNVELADQALDEIRRTQPLLDNWTSSLESASAIAKVSPFYRWAQKEISEQLQVAAGMDYATRNLRVLTRRVDYLVRDSKPRPQLAEVIGKIIIATELLEQTSDDFSVTQKARKYLRKIPASLDPKTFDPPLTTSESAVLMQIRPLFIDLAIAAGIQPSQARALLPYVD